MERTHILGIRTPFPKRITDRFARKLLKVAIAMAVIEIPEENKDALRNEMVRKFKKNYKDLTGDDLNVI